MSGDSDVPPGFLGLCCWVSGHGLGGLVKQFELYRSPHAQGGVTPLTVVENLGIVEDGVAKSMRVFHRFRLSSSVCILAQNDSMTALSQH
jgi:hypothetical protein